MRPGRPLRLLLLKPYQSVVNYVVGPPLGLLQLAATVRERFGPRVVIRLVDAKLRCLGPEELLPELEWADVVGLSALNYEAPAVEAILALTRRVNPGALTVLGGPYAHHRGLELLRRHRHLDWLFDGEADRTFPAALAAHFYGEGSIEDLPGVYRRDAEGTPIAPREPTDRIADLDALPLPAWDLVDFDAYAAAPNMNVWLKGRRYASLFTSRGCPYKCAYCHDIFGKRFRWRSPEHVLREIELLHDRYGVDEFQIIDDIFNLHKPRLKRIFAEIEARWGRGRFHFCFPNGLRGDILDTEVIDTLARGGTYQITVAVETVTPRLQCLIQKDLDIPKVAGVIDYCHQRGILTKGYFMLGFPTETPGELWATIRFAWRSKLTFAAFFTVVPQPGTPLYELARRESSKALAQIDDTGYYGRKSWYQLAYERPLHHWSRLAYLGFYLRPSRMLRIARHLGPRWLRYGLTALTSILLRHPRLFERLVRRRDPRTLAARPPLEVPEARSAP